MKDVEFFEEDTGFENKKRTWTKEAASLAMKWVIKHKLARTEFQAYIFLIVVTLVLFLTAIAMFLYIPDPYTPPAPVNEEVANPIKLPPGVKI